MENITTMVLYYNFRTILGTLYIVVLLIFHYQMYFNSIQCYYLHVFNFFVVCFLKLIFVDIYVEISYVVIYLKIYRFAWQINSTSYICTIRGSSSLPRVEGPGLYQISFHNMRKISLQFVDWSRTFQRL